MVKSDCVHIRCEVRVGSCVQIFTEVVGVHSEEVEGPGRNLWPGRDDEIKGVCSWVYSLNQTHKDDPIEHVSFLFVSYFILILHSSLKVFQG